jgi:hypothetical protein
MTVTRITPMVIAALTMSVGCGRSATSPTILASASAVIASAGQTSSGGGGGTVKETLTGPAIGGVVPQGQALADMSRFSSGGSTTLTVQIKNVNLANGVVLQVTLDFTPVGTITLSGGAGTLVTSLGHFGVSRDQVRVNNAGTTILSGGFFQ